MNKKVFKLFFSVIAIALILILSKEEYVKAENITKDLATNTTFTEMVNKGDSIWYKVTMDNNGYFTINLKPHNITDSADASWRLRLYDDGANEITYWNGYSSIESCKISATKDDVYYVVIERYKNKDIFYDIEITNVADSAWEVENNDSQDTATELESNKSVTGMIMGDGDVDWYQFTMPSTKGYVQFVLDKDVTVKEKWGMVILDETGSEIKSYYGDGITSHVLPYKTGTKLYVKIYAYNSGARWYEYKITPSFTEDSLWETEDNNTEKTATPLDLGTKKVYKGLVQDQVDGKDVDYYKFKISGEKKGETKSFKKVDINFGPDQISSKGTWKVELINSDGTAVELFRSDTKCSYQCYLKKGTYYLRVTAYYSDARNIIYTVNVKGAKVSKPTIELKSIKITQNSSWSGAAGTCKLSKLTKGITEFMIYWSESSNMKDASSKSFSSTVKTFDFELGKYWKNAGKAYFQVSALIRDPFGNKLYESARTKALKVSHPKSSW